MSSRREKPDTPPHFLARHAFLPWFLALGVALYAVFAPSGYMDYRETRMERERLEAEIAELEAENRRLRERIERLRTEPDFLEQLAREKLGMVYPDEKIVIMPRSTP